MEYILIEVFVSILVILALREVYCWYCKINRSIKLQEEIAGTLQRILEHLRKGENTPK